MALQERYSGLLDKCVGSLKTWKDFINEHLEEPDKELETKKLQELAKEYCVIDNNHRRSEKAITELEEAISDPSQTYKVDTIYQEKLARQAEEDPTENEVWRQLFYNDLSVREIKPKKKKDNTEYEEVDDSLLFSSSFTAPVDPISKVVIRKPIRNKKCKHIYDSQSIHDYIRQSKNRAKCPYMGCKNNHLTPADLQPDSQLEERITQYLASQNQECSDDDDDEESD